MKKAAFILIIGIALISSRVWADDGAKSITIKEYMFHPADMNVPAGSKVTWTNQDDVPHTVVATGKEFRSAAMDTNDSFTFTFAKPGVYHYFCTLHPQMVGTITVTAAAK